MNTITCRQVLLMLTIGSLAQAAAAEQFQRDPFRPPADFSEKSAAEKSPAVNGISELRIHGILLTGDTALLNIDGRLIAPGEEVDGYRLLEIGETHARLQQGERIFTVELYPSEQKDAGE